jgi:hypothetical protein
VNIRKELGHVNDEQLATAMLSSAYMLLAMAPYDSWGHEGTPAEMAAYVIKDAKDKGRLGMVFEALGITGRSSYNYGQ